MIEALYVQKRYGTYSDIFLMLGLAQLTEYSLNSIGCKKGIQIIDEGVAYRLQFKQGLDLEQLENIEYADLFPPVKGKRISADDIPDQIVPFDTLEHSEALDFYRQYIYQGGKKLNLGDASPDPPDPRTKSGLLLVDGKMSKLWKGFNKLWLEAYGLRQDFGNFAASVLYGFCQENISDCQEVEEISNFFKEKSSLRLPGRISAVKVFIPTAV